MTDLELARKSGAQVDTMSSNGKVFIDFTPEHLAAFTEAVRQEERERAEQDARRLDWLEQFYSETWHSHPKWSDFMRSVAERGFRASVDAAILAQEQKR